MVSSEGFERQLILYIYNNIGANLLVFFFLGVLIFEYILEKSENLFLEMIVI